MSLSLLLTCALAASSGEPVAITVDDTQLTTADVAARAKEFRARGVAVDARQLADTLVGEVLLANDARRSGLSDGSDARIWVGNARQRLLATAFLERVLGKGLAPTAEHVRALFHQNLDTVKLQMVVLTNEADARAARDRIVAGGDWALETARSLSFQSTQGMTPLMNRSTIDPALAEVAFKAPLNQITGPTALTLGFGVFRVVERTIADEAGLPAKRAALEQYGRNELLGAARAHFLKGMRAKAKVTIDEPFLVSMGKATEPTPAQATHPVATIGGKPVLYQEVLPALRTFGGGGGHAAGAAVKTQIITSYVDERLLANAAVAAGLDRQPDLARGLWRSDIQILAAVAADRLRATRAKGSPSDRERAVSDRIAELRKRSKVTLNDAGLKAALDG